MRKKSKPSPRVRFPATVLWLLLVLVIIGAGAVRWGVAHFEDDLTVRSEAVLAAAGYRIDVRFEGRDASLSGSVTSEQALEDVAALVGGLSGVRVVRATGISITAPPPPPAPSPPPGKAVEIRVEADRGLAIVSGSVRDARDAAGILAAVIASYGPTAVTDELAVRVDVGPAPWLPEAAEALREIGPLRDGTVDIDQSGVLIEGIVGTEAARDAIIVAFATTGLFVDDQLFVGTLARPSVAVSRAASTADVIVGGTFADQTMATTFMTAAVTAYGANDVTDETTIGLVDNPGFLVDIAALIQATVALESWSIQLDDGVLTVVGRAAGGTSLDMAREAFAVATVPGLDFGVQLELTAGAVGGALTDLFAGVHVFAPSSADLTDEAQTLLDEAFAIMFANPSAMLIVEGHTDDTGDAEINRVLSQARAEAVIVYLIAGGVDAGRLGAIGFGEDRPIATNATEEGRAMNRRIEFVPQDRNGQEG